MHFFGVLDIQKLYNLNTLIAKIYSFKIFFFFMFIQYGGKKVSEIF